MTQRDRLLLAVIVPVVVVAAYWLLLLSPRLDRLHKADGDLASAHSALTSAQSALADARAQSAQLAQQTKALRASSLAVPATADTPSLLRQLQRAADRSGVDLTSVTPDDQSSSPADGSAPAVASGDTSTLNLALGFSGTYKQTQRFLRSLNGLVRVTSKDVKATGRLIAISSVQFAPEAGGLNATVAASYYTLSATTPGDATP